VVLPSLYEGFGFSVLEAMASGTPAIGARAASIPEVVGNAGLLFDPSDEENLHSCIEQILTNDDLCRSLIHKGYERAQQFTWEQCTDRTIHVYREALS
jgi:glycosyltransferase involved in cell wall biosynthesis